MIPHVHAGQSPEGIVDSAAVWNEIADMANHFRGVGRGLPTNNTTPTNPCQIKVRNDASADLTFGQVLDLTEYVLREKPDPQHVWCAGDIPTLSLGRVPVILQQPAQRGKWADAQISGVCLASVEVGDTGHRFALVQDGSHNLQSVSAGPIRLLVPPHKVDTLLLPVVLQPSDPVALGTATGLVEYLTLGSVSLFSGMLDAVGPTIDNVFNASRDIPGGEPVKVQWINQQAYMFPIYDQVTVVCKPTNDITKGGLPGQCVIYQAGVSTGSAISARALGVTVRAGKWCLAFQEVASGVWYVGPWECT